MNEISKKVIFINMDGVLADFSKAVLDQFKLHPTFKENIRVNQILFREYLKI